MSVLIKGMEMPKNCCECIISQTHALNNEIVYQCPFTGYFNSRVVTSQRRMNDCPFVELPPHGRLIDADALRHWILTEMASLDSEEDREFVADRLANELPTIIEAEEDDDE